MKTCVDEHEVQPGCALSDVKCTIAAQRSVVLDSNDQPP